MEPKAQNVTQRQLIIDVSFEEWNVKSLHFWSTFKRLQQDVQYTIGIKIKTT